MSKAYDKVVAGLGDARGYLKGERDGFAVHEIEVPEPDVVAIRGKTGLSHRLLPRVSAFRLVLSRIGSRNDAGRRGRHACFLR